MRTSKVMVAAAFVGALGLQGQIRDVPARGVRTVPVRAAYNSTCPAPALVRMLSMSSVATKPPEWAYENYTQVSKWSLRYGSDAPALLTGYSMSQGTYYWAPRRLGPVQHGVTMQWYDGDRLVGEGTDWVDAPCEIVQGTFTPEILVKPPAPAIAPPRTEQEAMTITVRGPAATSARRDYFVSLKNVSTTDPPATYEIRGILNMSTTWTPRAPTQPATPGWYTIEARMVLYDVPGEILATGQKTLEGYGALPAP